MDRFLEHMRANLDGYESLFHDDLHIRVCVWPVGSVTAAHSSIPGPETYPPTRYGFMLKQARISPHAVEIRTPIQIRAHIFGGGVGV